MNSTPSKDENVQIFLEELMIVDIKKFNIVQALRKIVFANCRETSERMMYGGIMFSGINDFGGVFCRKNHISFEFLEGLITAELL